MHMTYMHIYLDNGCSKYICVRVDVFVRGICDWNCVYACMSNIKNYIKKINEILFLNN